MRSNCQIQAPLAVLDAVSDDITKIDRMDRRALFTSHYTRDGKRTLCGLTLEVTQSWCDNGFCRRCEKIAVQCHNKTPHGVLK